MPTNTAQSIRQTITPLYSLSRFITLGGVAELTGIVVLTGIVMILAYMYWQKPAIKNQINKNPQPASTQ